MRQSKFGPQVIGAAYVLQIPLLRIIYLAYVPQGLNINLGPPFALLSILESYKDIEHSITSCVTCHRNTFDDVILKLIDVSRKRTVRIAQQVAKRIDQPFHHQLLLMFLSFKSVHAKVVKEDDEWFGTNGSVILIMVLLMLI